MQHQSGIQETAARICSVSKSVLWIVFSFILFFVLSLFDVGKHSLDVAGFVVPPVHDG